ncbi:unnamed protein product [Coregonus sp. 'balchen']|nr:unnamed protein product [Coregonus sp. 'balchen']
MATPIDLELKKAKLADLQIDQLTRMKKHANLTHAEIKTLPDNTRMYEGQRKTYLERTVKDAEDNIREMLMSRRAQ